MDIQNQPAPESPDEERVVSGLQEALQRLTSPQVEPIQVDLDGLRRRIQDLQESLTHLEQEYLQNAGALHTEFPDLIPQIHGTLNRLKDLEEKLADPDEVSARMSPVLVDVIADRVNREQDRFADAISPVMGPAIRSQIRNEKEEIIDALFPIMGQIISKSISESIRELSRNIDRRLRRRLSLTSVWENVLNRIRGVSESDQLMRDAFDYSVDHIFLIHRHTGLLIEHMAAPGKQEGEFSTITGMLTAISSFVEDSFGRGEGELEEIAYGRQRILLDTGRNASIAVVLDGIEPTGYAGLMNRVTSEINLQHERWLDSFFGDVDDSPDFKPELSVLIRPDEKDLDFELEEPFDKNQRRILTGLIAAAVLALAIGIFACVFVVRLWPYAFGAVVTLTPLPPTATSTAIPPTATLTPLPTQTPSPTIEPSPTFTSSPEPTATQTELPTATSTPTAVPLPAPSTGTLTGNVNLRSSPTSLSELLGTILTGDTVVVLDEAGGWYLVRWEPQDGQSIEGWVWGRYLLFNGQP